MSLKKFVYHKSDNGLIQFIRYFAVGGLAAIIDFSSFIFFVKILNLHYQVSLVFSFVLGTFTNFLLCEALVFKRYQISFLKSGARHFVSSLGGLATNLIVATILVETGILTNLALVKIIAIGSAFFVNFTLIKFFAFKNNFKAN